MMNKSIEASEENLLHIYNRFPIAFEHGEGMYLYDENSKKYLDFGAGFAVSALGYGNKKLAKALKKQIDLLYHTSNLYYHKNCAEAAEKLNQYAQMDKIFFTNSGAEAIEDMRIIKNPANINLLPWKILFTDVPSERCLSQGTRHTERLLNP